MATYVYGTGKEEVSFKISKYMHLLSLVFQYVIQSPEYLADVKTFYNTCKNKGEVLFYNILIMV